MTQTQDPIQNSQQSQQSSQQQPFQSEQPTTSAIETTPVEQQISTAPVSLRDASVVESPVTEAVSQIPPELQDTSMDAQSADAQQPSFVDSMITKGVKAVASITGNPDPIT